MNKAERYARTAGITYGIVLVLDVIRQLVQGNFHLTIATTLWWSFLLLDGIVILINNRSPLLAVGAGINVLRTVYVSATSWSTAARGSYIDKLFVLCNVLSALALLVLLVLWLSNRVDRRTAARSIWFLPGLLLILRYAPVWVTFNYAALQPVSFLGLLGQAFHLAAFFLTGAWINLYHDSENWPFTRPETQEDDEEPEEIDWE